MVTAPFRPSGGNVYSIILKYKFAKFLTIVSLIAVLLIAFTSLISPEFTWRSAHATVASDEDVKGQDEQVPSCQLPTTIVFPASPDGSYTPPSPHSSLNKAIAFASQADQNAYCQKTDPINGFTDEMPYNIDGKCGTWQASYKALHARRLEQLERIRQGDLDSIRSDDDRPLFVSYLCKEVVTNRGCGGLADRMGGMISTFFYALITDRAYLAHWADENPIPLEILFEQPSVNWTYDPHEMQTLFSQNDDLLSYQPVDLLNQKWRPLGEIVFRDGPKQDFHTLWDGTYVEMRSNRAYIIRTFQKSTIYPDLLGRMGLTKENTFGCLADFLFRPTIGSRRYLNAYKHLFVLDSILSIGLQIRTDDNALANPQYDGNSLDKWGHFWKCARQLTTLRRQSHHRHVVYFLVTDSHHLREQFVLMNDQASLAQKHFGDDSKDATMVVTGLPLEHIEPDQVARYINVSNPIEVSRARMTPGVNSAVIDNWLLSSTDYRIISPQGYGKLAAFHSKSDHSTISMPRLSRKMHVPDCSDPSSMTTYDWLSTQWSLG